MKDIRLKSLISGSHGWQADNQGWVFGVVHPKDGVHSLDVVNHMLSLGVTVLPSIWDTTTLIESKVYLALSQWISSSDRTKDIALKIGKMHPLLMPHLY